MADKISIRFFDEREACVVWDDMKKENNELVSHTTRLELTMGDGEE